MAEYAQWVIDDLLPFGMYVLGGAILFMIVVTIMYAFFYVCWIVHIFATIKGNLLADKLEEKAQTEFEHYCDTLDGSENG